MPVEPAATPAKSPRTELLEALSRAISATAAAGDLEAARVAHEALGRLLTSAAAEPAGVTPIAKGRR